MVKKIGILALQGNFDQHKKMFDLLGIDNIFIRYSSDVEKCDAIVIPGGESTTMSKQIDRNNLRHVLKEYSKTNSLFGTCAGMILLSSNNESKNLQPLGIMDFTINRNAYGKQIESFSDDLQLNFSDATDFHAVFIRSPKVSKIGKNIKILAKYKKQPVMITDGRHFVTTFHPEIGSDIRIHNYFMEQINA